MVYGLGYPSSSHGIGSELRRVERPAFFLINIFMRDTWFDSHFIDLYNKEIMPLFEGPNLDSEIRSQSLERKNLQVRNKNIDRQQKVKNRVEKARRALRRGKARQLDALLGYPMTRSKSTTIPGAQSSYSSYYEEFDPIFESSKRVKNDMFRMGGFRKQMKMDTKISSSDDPKERDRIRKQAERKLGMAEEIEFSITSFPIFEQEEQEQVENSETETQSNEQEGGQQEPQEQLPYITMLYQLSMVRNKPKNVFENISNISYKNLVQSFGVKSLNKDDRDFQIENALIFISRVCSGATPQELELMQQFENSRFFDFDEKAFDKARSLLLQLGEKCVQNLIHAKELEIVADQPGFERTQVMCGDNAFKIVTGRTYVKDSTDSPNYGMKMTFVLQNIFSEYAEQLIVGNEYLTLMVQELATLIQESKDTDEDLVNEQIQSIILDNLKQKMFLKNSDFENLLKILLTRHHLYGSNIIDPRSNATHLLTDTGLFEISEGLLEVLSKNASLKIKVKNKFKSTFGRRDIKSILPKNIEKYKTIVEQVKEKMGKKRNQDQLLQSVPTIVLNSILSLVDFEFDLTINPGEKITSTKRKNDQYNTIFIKDKQVKIPVTFDRGDMMTNTIKEDVDYACNILLENKTINEFMANKIKRSNNMNGVPKEIMMLIASIINDTNCSRRESIVEKLEGYEKKYSKKTSHHRSNRNKARRAAEKKFGTAAIKGKDVDHKDGNPMNNSPSNLRLRSKGDNRSDNGHHKGEPHKKAMRGITSTFKGKKK